MNVGRQSMKIVKCDVFMVNKKEGMSFRHTLSSTYTNKDYSSTIKIILSYPVQLKPLPVASI